MYQINSGDWIPPPPPADDAAEQLLTKSPPLRLLYNTLVGIVMGGICFEVGLGGQTARENAGYLFFSIIFLFIGAMVASARRSKFDKDTVWLPLDRGERLSIISIY